MDPTDELLPKMATLYDDAASSAKTATEHLDDHEATVDYDPLINPKYVKAVLAQLEKKYEKLTASCAKVDIIRRRLREHETTMTYAMRRRGSTRALGIAKYCIDSSVSLISTFRKTISLMKHYAGSTQSFRDEFSQERVDRILAHPQAELVKADVQKISTLLKGLSALKSSLANCYTPEADRALVTEMELMRYKMMLVIGPPEQVPSHGE